MSYVATLKRLRSDSQGTFGSFTLFKGGAPVFSAHSLELPWRNNTPSVSCIPVGVYECEFTWSPRFRKRMYLVGQVRGRVGVRIHSANLAGDVSAGYKAQLNGCIALGLSVGFLENQAAVLRSALAVYNFERMLKGAPFSLKITKEG